MNYITFYADTITYCCSSSITQTFDFFNLEFHIDQELMFQDNLVSKLGVNPSFSLETSAVPLLKHLEYAT